MDLERTTNMQEAFNRKLQCCNYSGDHPSIYALSSLLLNVNEQIQHSMDKHITAGLPEKKTKKV